MLPYGYKELTIPPLENGSFALKREALHIWPRKQFMLIGLPNPDGSFTGTLFLPLKGAVSFESLNSEEEVEEFFQEQFKDAVPLIPELKKEFLENPTGSLGTVRLAPWFKNDHTLLLGDAAHGIVPFYGQGMNCAFESCHVFVDILKNCDFNWSKALPETMEARKVHADAIASLALQNFVEMQDHVADARFLLKKEVLKTLEEKVQGFLTEYSLVTFTNTPYADALAQGKLQSELVDKIVGDISKIDEIDWSRAEQLAREYVASR